MFYQLLLMILCIRIVSLQAMLNHDRLYIRCLLLFHLFFLINQAAPRVSLLSNNTCIVDPPSLDTVFAIKPIMYHSMITRSWNNISKLKTLFDDFVRYPLPKALISSLKSQEVESTYYSEVVKSQH
jgi:hypothetical protein